MKLTPVLFTALALFSLNSQAANQDELTDYQRWLQGTQKEFKSYLDANDKAFLNFLNQTWQEVDVQEADIRDPEPKPITLPVAQPDNDTPSTPGSTPNTQPDTTPIVAVIPANPEQEPAKSAPPQPDPGVAVVSRPVKKGPVATFQFFGNPVSIAYPKKFKAGFRQPLKDKRIATYWQTLASTNHQPVVQAIQETASALSLNDWGTALLIDQFARTLHNDENSRALTSWFLLVKSGYDARIAYNQRVYLLMTAKQALYGVTFFTLDGRPYYALGLNEQSVPPGQVYTYGAQHDAGQKPLDFSQPYRFAAGAAQAHRTLSFRYGGTSHQLTLDYPKGYIHYLKDYPQLALPSYFSAGLPAATAQQTLDQLRPIVAGLSEQEAVNTLLRFVQTAFEYATDKQQFNEENYLFPLETLHYPYSDCEDRAALFAWLTRSLLGLDVMIVEYPGHVATAVAFSGQVAGTGWEKNGTRYVIADPTYVNANAGMVMPNYARANATLKPF